MKEVCFHSLVTRRFVTKQSTRTGRSSFNSRKVYVLNTLYTDSDSMKFENSGVASPDSGGTKCTTLARNIAKVMMDGEFLTGEGVVPSYAVYLKTRYCSFMEQLHLRLLGILYSHIG